MNRTGCGCGGITACFERPWPSAVIQQARPKIKRRRKLNRLLLNSTIEPASSTPNLDKIDDTELALLHLTSLAEGKDLLAVIGARSVGAVGRFARATGRENR